MARAADTVSPPGSGGPARAVQDAVRGTARAVRDVEGHYGRGDRALRGYVPLLGAFAMGLVGMTIAVRRSGRRPAPLTPFELGCLALATHKVSRLVAKDAVTSPLRAPFTRFEGPADDAELDEDVTGSGVRKAVGELVTCPFCIGPWAATAFMAGHTFSPTLTRAATSVLSAVTVSDFLQLGYAAAQQRTAPPDQRDN
jgi:hypothetical protein